MSVLAWRRSRHLPSHVAGRRPKTLPAFPALPPAHHIDDLAAGKTHIADAMEAVVGAAAVPPAHAHRRTELLQHLAARRARVNTGSRAYSDDGSGVAWLPRDAIGFEIDVRAAGRRLGLSRVV